MIMKFLQKVPAGLMLVPLLIGAVIHTLFPQALEIGGLTTAAFSNAGAATCMGLQLFCLGTTLQLKDMPAVLKRGGTLLLSKFLIGAILGIVVGKVFGQAGFWGLTALSIVAGVTNSNGSLYLSLVKTYGDEADAATVALLALGASGMASIPMMSLVAVIVPMILGMIIGNVDKSMMKFFAPMADILIPFVGLTLGAGINLKDVVKGGPQGILLGLITVFVGGFFTLFFDRLICKQPGYAAFAVASTAGNSVAVPAAVVLIDKTWAPYQAVATTQLAASVVVTAILVPIVTSIWAKKYGCPQLSSK